MSKPIFAVNGDFFNSRQIIEHFYSFRLTGGTSASTD
jgi:hypothetical protein